MAAPQTLTRLAVRPVGEVPGVGAKLERSLAQVGVTSVLDLITYYPRRYLDRTRQSTVGDLHVGEESAVVVRVVRASTRPTRNRRPMVTVDVVDASDGGRGRMKLTFFNQPWRVKQLHEGLEVVVFGRLEDFRGQRQMTNPVVDLVGDKTRRIIPVYPQSERAGLNSGDLAPVIERVIEKIEGSVGFAEPVAPAVLRRLGLVDRTTAFRGIHRPETMAEAEVARRRLVFDELLRVQVQLVRRKLHLDQTTLGLAHDVAGLDQVGLAAGGSARPGTLLAAFLERLPFPLTGAQRRAIDEVAADLARPRPMHRLLQGDVGAGKTLVAVATLLMALEGGQQGALMAPTEVLAEQHAVGVRALLEGLEVADETEGSLFSGAGGTRPLEVALLANRTTAAERRRVLAGLADGSVDLAVGTHALIQEGVAFRSLGAVVIDEQHRFGVEQRAALREKSAGEAVPDVLVMTATPIPRTAAMTVYGDLDVSVLDELPPGRTPIVTSWAADDADEAEVWAAVREEVAAGRQAYVVCPLVGESEKLEVASAEETFERLRVDELEGLRLGLLHGRVSAAEKEATMDLFRAGRLDVLVATTVIEVGVDVPNATVMVILDADRFGIAQLHQLRGRVGRGAAASRCFLVADLTRAGAGQVVGEPGEKPARGKKAAAPADGPDERKVARERLEAMVRTTDGFELAEVDLDLRGEGTIMGERQKGRNDLKLASLRRDREWVATAREVALELVGDDPDMAGHPLLAAEVDLLLAEDDADFLLKS